MSEKRFTLDELYCYIIQDNKKRLTDKQVVDLLNEYETVLSDTQTFALNLCKFLMEKRLDEEFRKKYGDESLSFKMSNAVYGCGDDV